MDLNFFNIFWQDSSFLCKPAERFFRRLFHYCCNILHNLRCFFLGAPPPAFGTNSSYFTKPHHTCVNLLNRCISKISNAILYGILPFTILLPFSVLKMTLRKKNLGSKVNILKCHFDNSNQAANSQCCQSNLKIIT
jgi:hypothetical protein